MGLNGTLPADWGSDGGLQKLRQLWIDGNNLSGGQRLLSQMRRGHYLRLRRGRWKV